MYNKVHSNNVASIYKQKFLKTRDQHFNAFCGYFVDRTRSFLFIYAKITIFSFFLQIIARQLNNNLRMRRKHHSARTSTRYSAVRMRTTCRFDGGKNSIESTESRGNPNRDRATVVSRTRTQHNERGTRWAINISYPKSSLRCRTSAARGKSDRGSGAF